MNENYEAWLDYLSTTDDLQAGDQLVGTYSPNDEPLGVDEKGYELVGFCCLGIACKIAPEEIGKPYLDLGEYTLLPVRVAEWLGLGDKWAGIVGDTESPNWATMVRNFPDRQVDLYIDWPEEEYPIKDWSGDRITASALNDKLFTFAQIADIIRYFGISEVKA